MPAALVDPAPLIWRIVGILRAAGWYALAPFLIYSILAAFKVQDKGERQEMLWFAGVALVWVVVSSFRAGGSQWDNPRYRTILLPWMALLAGWAYTWARARLDPWLVRILAVEGIFLLFFTEWYFSRYTRLIPRPPFWVVTGLIVIFSLGVVVGGWLRDRSRSRRALTQPPEPL
jgi:peptidoglycan/LPS O-acetylase OafA/YrhL